MRVVTRGVSSVMAALAGKLLTGRSTAAAEKAAACCRASRRERCCGDQARDSRREARTATIQKVEDFIFVEGIYYGRDDDGWWLLIGRSQTRIRFHRSPTAN